MADLQRGVTINSAIIGKKGTASCTGTTLTLDISSGTYFEVDLQNLSGDISTFRMENYSAVFAGCQSYTLKLTQSSTARQFTWSSLVPQLFEVGGSEFTNNWHFVHIGGEHPYLSEENNAVNIMSIISPVVSDNSLRDKAWLVAMVGTDFQ
jgi:hypothetical protein